MNIRTFATIFALITPVIVLYFVTQYAGTPHESTPSGNPKPEIPVTAPQATVQPQALPPSQPPASRSGELEFLRKRISELENMTDTQWQEDHDRRMQERRFGHRPARMAPPRPYSPNAGRATEIIPAPASPVTENFPDKRPTN